MSIRPDRRKFLQTLAAGVAAAPVISAFHTVEEAFALELGSLAGPSRPFGPLPLPPSRFMLDPEVTYLNHASIGTVPRAVYDALMEYFRICEENPWLYIWGGAWEEARESVRGKAAALLRCSPEEVALIRNSTEGFNVLARGLPLASGDEVLFSSLNHVGASAAWRHVATERGFTVRGFPFPLDRVPDLTESEVADLYLQEIRPNTRVLVFPDIDNMVGLRHPVGAIARGAKDLGVEFVVADGAQGAGMIPLDLEGSGVDAYSASAHKWIQSPKGLGVFYVRKEIQERLKPLIVTWGQAQWRGSARAYEDYGTRDFPMVLSLGDALDFQEALGAEVKRGHFRRLRSMMYERVSGDAQLAWRSPRVWPMGAAFFSVEVVGRDSNQLSEMLYRDHGVVVRPFRQPGLNALRIAPGVMNTEEELDRLLTLIRP